MEGRSSMEDVELGHGNNPNGLDAFAMEVNNLQQDIYSVDQLFASLFESNEEVKSANSANAMRQGRENLMGHLDDLHKLAKQMEKKFDALVRTNAAQRRDGSLDHQNRASMFSQIEDDINEVMRNFQGLRAQMEADHRQVIETRYFAISGEKATAEAIERIITSEVAASPLHEALVEQGRGPVMEVVAEIEERRDTMMEMRRSLMNVHQILLGIARPVVVEPTAQAQNNAVVEAGPTAAEGGINMKGGLNDFEKETRKQAYIAIAIALLINIFLVIALLNKEHSLENNYGT